MAERQNADRSLAAGRTLDIGYRFTTQNGFCVSGMNMMMPGKMADEEGDDKKNECLGRQLGLSELFFHHSQNKLDYTIVFQSATLKSNYFFEAVDVEETLKILVQFQPLLRMKVVEKANGPSSEVKYYLEPTEVDIPSRIRVKHRCPNEDLSFIIEEEEYMVKNKDKSAEGPAWKVVLAIPDMSTEQDVPSEQQNYTYQIVFIMSHVISDGVSAYDMLYRQFLPILNQIINNRPVDEKFLHPLDLTPSLQEEIFNVPNSSDLQPSWKLKLLANLIRAKNKLFTRNLYEPIFKSQGSPFDNGGAGPITKVLKKEFVDKILEQRKLNSVRVHPILLAAFSFALAKLMSENGYSLPNEIKSEWAIDCRKEMEKYKSPQPLGVLIATSTTTKMKLPNAFTFNKEEFWLEAREIAKQVEKQKEEIQTSELSYDILTYVIARNATENDASSHMFELGILPHFYLSNLSKSSPGPELSVTSPNFVDAEEMFVGCCGKGFGSFPTLFFSTTTYHKGQICVAFCYNKKWLDLKCAKQLAENFEEILKVACD